MKLTLIAYGTRGDVQPFVVLGWSLARRGHEVTIAAPTNMGPFVQQAGLHHLPLPVDVQALFARETAQRMLADGRIQAFFKWLAQEELTYKAELRQALRIASDGADALIVHPLVEDRAAALGAARRIPVIPLYFFPIPSSRRFASPFITVRNLGPLNGLTHTLLLNMLWKLSRDDVAVFRRELGVPPAGGSYAREVRRRGLLALLSYSPSLFARPEDWAEHYVQLSSFVMPDELKLALGEHGLPLDLQRWLAQGTPPIYFGFGSMPILDRKEMTETVRTALRAIGARGVIVAGWSDLVAANDAELCVVDRVDHAALFNRCLAAVHHGGSGTTYATLRSGLPTLVASVFADQPLWGARCRALGVGETFPFSKLSVRSLTVGLRAILSAEVGQRARALGSSLVGEAALEAAVNVIEERAPSLPPPE